MGMAGAPVEGSQPPNQIWAVTLTLFQQGGTDYAHHIVYTDVPTKF